MGQLNSRRVIMMMDEDEDSRSRIDDTSEESSSDSEGESSAEHNFVEMLHNLISSGQLLLQGGDEEYFPTRRMPKIKCKPDTTILDKSEFSLLTKQACGLLETRKKKMPRNNNVASMIMNRECGTYSHESFSKGTKCHITNQYLPNEMTACLDGSSGKVFCGIFSPDGNCFLTASQDRHLRLYNSQNSSYNMIKTIRARDVGWSIIDCAFSHDSESFVYSTWSSSIHLCPTYGSSEHQEPLTLLNTSRRFCVFSVVFSADNRELLCGANDGSLYIYDRERNGRTLKIVAHDYDVNRVLFADNSSHIIYSGGDDGLVKVWDRRSMDDRNAKPVGVLAGHMDGITYIDSRGDSRYLISNSKDQSIKLWDVRVFSDDRAVKQSLKAAHSQTWDYRWQGVPKELYSDNKLEGDSAIMTYRGHVVVKTLLRCRFSPAETTGQRYIYTGCGNGRVVIYDALTGKIVKQKKGHMACVRDVSWHPTRNEILSSSWDGMIGKWVYNKMNLLQEKQESDLLSKDPTRPVRRSARLAAQKAKMRESMQLPS